MPSASDPRPPPSVEQRLDLAIVVVSYNVRDLLRECLTALRESSRESGIGRPHPSTAAVVVDNASFDGSAEMVATEFPEVRLLALDDNRGFAAANNLGLREVDARYVLLLNPDTRVLGDAPGALVRFMDAHPRVGVSGGRLLNPDLTFQHAGFRFPTLPMSFIDLFPTNHRILDSRINGRYPRARYGRAFPIDHPLGAAMIARREAIEEAGPMDEGYFMYCEEVDWCYRIKRVGWEIYYTPDAEIIHHAAASTRQFGGPMLVQLHRSRDRFFRRHYGSFYAALARWIVRLGMADAARRARAQARRGEIDDAELQRRLAAYRAVIAG